MSSARKLAALSLAFTCAVVGVAMELRSLPRLNSVGVQSNEVASRYHLRKRTPDFFSRSKTSVKRPSRA